MSISDKSEIRKQWKKAEDRWQKTWLEKHTFKATNPGDPDHDPHKKKFYCLDMFPYPSGDGLHVGHPLGYIATDILCRFKRMAGYNVLHPMGWDAYGLPAEQHAIQKGVHPEVTTQKNIETYKRQLQSLGLSYDWSREINTTSPQYYRWTQWIFKQMAKQNLAYQDEVAVNWCPELGTVLANDEVVDGKSERGGHPVVRKPMRQWMMKITSYAEKLLKDLDSVDWPESTKELQRNWIGKSEGARVQFPLKNTSDKLDVFTTRPDTLFGVTFMVVAPEHPALDSLTSPEQKNAVQDYVKEAAKKSDLQRTDLNKDKSGVFTGGYVLHPLSGQEVPVWVADYVLINYGTGAIMAVPAHDERDHEFAEKFELPIVPVIDSNNKLINSSFGDLNFNGTDASEAIHKISSYLEEKALGKKETTYRLRDWIFSRQRYWGEAIPVVHTPEGESIFLEDEELPLEPPRVESYKPTGTGESPLAAIKEWVHYQKGSLSGQRETNTMPGSAASSWYYLRYMDPHNDQAAWSPEAQKYWGPVDFYLGGSEHAVGHLLYSRFWHKVFFEMGLVDHAEPFAKLFHQGMMQGEDGEKMSKSRGNVVNPDNIIADYGADTFRLFEMFLGPIDKAKPWQTSNIEGTFRYLIKYWRLVCNPAGTALHEKVKDIPESQWPDKLRCLYHKTIKVVASDIERLSFNTAISSLMILLNEASSAWKSELPKEFVRTYTLLLSPFAPHICEEIWALLGHKNSLAREAWPSFDPKLTLESEIQMAIQVNGKVREKITVSPDISEEELKKKVLALTAIKKYLEGNTLRKFIYVKGKIISLVVN